MVRGDIALALLSIITLFTTVVVQVTALSSGGHSEVRRRPSRRGGQSTRHPSPSPSPLPSQPSPLPRVSTLHLGTAAARGRSAGESVMMGVQYGVTHPLNGLVGALETSWNGDTVRANRKLLAGAIGGLSGAVSLAAGGEQAIRAGVHLVAAGATTHMGPASQRHYDAHQRVRQDLTHTTTVYKARHDNFNKMLRDRR